MTDTHVTITGNLTDDPELKSTPNGHAVANIRVAVTARIKDGDTWKDGDTSFFRVNVWRQLARARQRLPQQRRPGGGHRPAGSAPAAGRPPEGDKRSVVEVEADEVAPSLRWAIAKPERATNGNGSKGKGGDFNDDAPSRPRTSEAGAERPVPGLAHHEPLRRSLGCTTHPTRPTPILSRPCTYWAASGSPAAPPAAGS
jgi:single-strand DNA-binding protein